jgi:hypothetical protein
MENHDKLSIGLHHNSNKLIKKQIKPFNFMLIRSEINNEVFLKLSL